MAAVLVLVALAQATPPAGPAFVTIGPPVELPGAVPLPAYAMSGDRSSVVLRSTGGLFPASHRAAPVRTVQNGPTLPSPYYESLPPGTGPGGPPPGPYYGQPSGIDPFAPGGPLDPYGPQMRTQSPWITPGDSVLPDRPRFLPRPDVVGRGQFGLELGYRATDFGDADVRTPLGRRPLFDGFVQNVGTGLVRYGLTDRLELRLGLEIEDSELSTVFGRDETIGSGAIDLGLKYLLSEQDGWRPKFSVLGEVGWLSAEDTSTARGRILGLSDWEFAPTWHVGLAGGLDFVGDTEVTESGVSGSLALSLEKRFDRVVVFGELANVRSSTSYAQLGVLVPVGDYVFLDASGGYAGYEEDFNATFGSGPSDVQFDGGFFSVGLTILSR